MTKFRLFLCALCGFFVLAGNAFGEGAESAAAPKQQVNSRWVGKDVEVRSWRGHQVVLVPPWLSEQAALGKEDTSGHIP